VFRRSSLRLWQCRGRLWQPLAVTMPGDAEAVEAVTADATKKAPAPTRASVSALIIDHPPVWSKDEPLTQELSSEAVRPRAFTVTTPPCDDISQAAGGAREHGQWSPALRRGLAARWHRWRPSVSPGGRHRTVRRNGRAATNAVGPNTIINPKSYDRL
jgi:hypothetical protein